MSANAVFIIVLVISVVASLLLAPVLLKWGLKWSRITEIGLLRAIGLWLLLIVINAFLVGGLLVALMAFGWNFSELTQNVLAFVGQFVASSAAIALIYKARMWRAALAVGPYYLGSLASVILAIGVIRPFTYEAYSIPTNSMAPTLLGEHVEAPCPRCGAVAYGSPLHARNPLSPSELLMVCGQERQSVLVKDVPQTPYNGDRLLTCKLLKPRRWDLITFHFPDDPSEIYVKRLVGLPGEKLAIHDGAVWINGERLEPPESIRGIHYSPTIDAGGQTFSGPGSSPVELGSDEYFVLGDFVDAASDSRMWSPGAPGHPPYAVPTSYLTGVVINIYWPPNRWTSFR